jgi:hypothetical protein
MALTALPAQPPIDTETDMQPEAVVWSQANNRLPSLPAYPTASLVPYGITRPDPIIQKWRKAGQQVTCTSAELTGTREPEMAY